MCAYEKENFLQALLAILKKVHGTKRVDYGSVNPNALRKAKIYTILAFLSATGLRPESWTKDYATAKTRKALLQMRQIMVKIR